MFGEDALVNLSVEKRDDSASSLASASADGTAVAVSAPAASSGAKLTGYIRIRSKTQGIALSLGDRITIVQRSSSATGGPEGSSLASKP